MSFPVQSPIEGFTYIVERQSEVEVILIVTIDPVEIVHPKRHDRREIVWSRILNFIPSDLVNQK